MTPIPLRSPGRRWLALPLLAVLGFAASANPGAHGPNGEHLDEPSASAAGTADARPRMETFSELFELVARLEDHALSVMVNRYESNEPVLDGSLEIESGELKAEAAFDPASGAFVATDKALLQLLSAPGQHPLVFTLSAGDDIDLLTGELAVGAAGSGGGVLDHGHADGGSRAWLWLALAALLVLAGGWWIRRRSRA